MTSIEWLWEQIDGIIPYQDIKTSQLFNGVLEQAKEMHKAEHGKTWDVALDKYEVRAGNYMRAYEDFDDYFQETFVSKGSDNLTKEIINFMKKEKERKEQLPQQEISDEEIDNAVVKEYENVGDEKLFPNHSDKDIWMNGFYEGAKWYREQLKSKTNE
jgi:hypothetical protein